MRAATFWRIVTADRSDFLGSIVRLLEEHAIAYCVVGGYAVDTYVEPLVGLDLELVIAVEQIALAESLFRGRFEVEPFPHSLNLSSPDSALRVQIQTDPRYFDFVPRAAVREVLGVELPVADVRDILQGKVWAALDSGRRPSKRRKDLLDIERLVESYPDLRENVPAELLERLG
jgi:hypothetical protein